MLCVLVAVLVLRLWYAVVLSVVCCSYIVGCCLLFVVCRCLLFVVGCCVLIVAWCLVLGVCALCVAAC